MTAGSFEAGGHVPEEALFTPEDEELRRNLEETFPDAKITSPLKEVGPEAEKRRDDISVFANVLAKEKKNEQGEWKEVEVSEDVELARPDIGIYGVFDGVGGLEKGKDAARLASQVVAEAVDRGPKRLEGLDLFRDFVVEDLRLPRTILYSKDELKDLLLQAIHRAHSRVRDLAQAQEVPMGTTASVFAIHETLDGKRTLVAVNVGDSRVYGLQAGELKRLTKDDSMVQMLEDSKYLPKDADQSIEERLPENIAERLKAKTVRDIRNRITQSLGMEEGGGPPRFSPHLIEAPLEQSNTVVAVSDGVVDNLLDRTIGALLKDGKSLTEAARATARTIGKAGGDPRAKADDMAEVRVTLGAPERLADYLERAFKDIKRKLSELSERELAGELTRIYSVRNQLEQFAIPAASEGEEKEKLAMLRAVAMRLLDAMNELQQAKGLSDQTTKTLRSSARRAQKEQ